MKRFINDKNESNDEESDDENMLQQGRSQRRRLERDAGHFAATSSITQVAAVRRHNLDLKLRQTFLMTPLMLMM